MIPNALRLTGLRNHYVGVQAVPVLVVTLPEPFTSSSMPGTTVMLLLFLLEVLSL